MNDPIIQWLAEPAPFEGNAVVLWPCLQRAGNLELTLFLEGLKPAVKLEDLTSAELTRHEQQAVELGLSASTLMQTGPTPQSRNLGDDGSGSSHTLFLARQGRHVMELMDMERLERRGGAGRAQAIYRSGRLLGYPDCCARAFCVLPRQDDTAVMAAYAQRGSGIPPAFAKDIVFVQASHPFLNMFPPMVSPVTWFPCTFECPSCQALAETQAVPLSRLQPDWSAEMAAGLPGFTLVFDRFLFLHFQDCEVDGKWLRFERVSDALSFAGDKALCESRSLSRFRSDVAAVVAGHTALRLDGETITLRDDRKRELQGRVGREMTLFEYPEFQGEEAA